MMPGTYFCRASAMFSDWVRWIWFTSTILTLAGTLSTSMPEIVLEPNPYTGVVGYTKRGGKARTVRRGLSAILCLVDGDVLEPTMRPYILIVCDLLLVLTHSFIR